MRLGGGLSLTSRLLLSCLLTPLLGLRLLLMRLSGGLSLTRGLLLDHLLTRLLSLRLSGRLGCLLAHLFGLRLLMGLAGSLSLSGGLLLLGHLLAGLVGPSLLLADLFGVRLLLPCGISLCLLLMRLRGRLGLARRLLLRHLLTHLTRLRLLATRHQNCLLLLREQRLGLLLMRQRDRLRLARGLLLRHLLTHLTRLRLLATRHQNCLLLLREQRLGLLLMRQRDRLRLARGLLLDHLLTNLIGLRLLDAPDQGGLLLAGEIGLRLLRARLGDRLGLLVAAILMMLRSKEPPGHTGRAGGGGHGPRAIALTLTTIIAPDSVFARRVLVVPITPFGVALLLVAPLALLLELSRLASSPMGGIGGFAAVVESGLMELLGVVEIAAGIRGLGGLDVGR